MQQNKRKKVNFWLNDTYPLFNKACKDTFGGAEVDLYTLARRMQLENTFDISFYVGGYGQKNVEFFEGIAVRRLPYFNLKKYRGVVHKILRQYYMWKEILLSDGDLHITETASELFGWLVILAKFLKGKKILFRLAHDKDTNIAFSRTISQKLYYLYKIGLLHCDAVISQTENQQRFLKENTNLDSTIIKNGFFIRENVDMKNKKYILWVARCEDWKRPEIFVELAQRCPQEKFVMIMPLSNGANAGFQAQIKEKIALVNSRYQNIENIDFVPFAEITKYYEGAKLFVNTSVHEGFPNAFVQSCLAKTPILSFNVNPDKFITKNNLGCFCENDLEKAVKFIQSLDVKQVEYYGGNAFDYVNTNHNIDTIYQQYDKIVHRLLE